ncbi:MAG TPA: hypothetical protein DCG54_12230 [Anaerolineae bacterium]|jgi:hypothetical protein|nr:hypothetical protein [Anaerolineae bacterium]
MKPIAEMNLPELAAYIQSHLHRAGIQVVLSGGSAVSFYSGNQYVSNDVDLIDNGLVSRGEIKKVMTAMGFRSDGRYYRHPETQILVEFPVGPLSVGEQLVKGFEKFELETGVLYVMSATDCVKDRLCAYYYWGDRQGLAQAIMVARQQQVDLAAIRQWSLSEGHLDKFEEFARRL